MLLVIIGIFCIILGVAVDLVLWTMFRKIGGFIIKAIAVVLTVLLVFIILSLVVCGMLLLAF